MPAQQVTQLLQAHSEGDPNALDHLLPLVYGELRALAQSVFSSQSADHTLQPTALAHEAWLKLARGLGPVEGKAHFLAVAARAMRQVLTDHARALQQGKREGRRHAVTLTGREPGRPDGTFDLIALDDSLRRLSELNPRHAKVVELRYLGGLTIAEAAAHIGVSSGTVENDWAIARAWLARELRTC